MMQRTELSGLRGIVEPQKPEYSRGKNFGCLKIKKASLVSGSVC